MTENNQLSKLATELFRTVSPVREIMNFADKTKLMELGVNENELISFGGGWVNHQSPSGLKDAYFNIITDKEKFHYSGGYSPTNGEVYCKKALVHYENLFFGIRDMSENNIVIGQSSSQLTYLLLQVILDESDKICLLDPSYCNFPLQIYTSTKSKIIRFPVIDPKSFKFIANEPDTISKFKDFLIINQPKIVLLVSPDNPTSQILSDEFFSQIYDTVKSYGGAIVIDFAYKEIVFGEYPNYFSKPPDENFFSIHSNSKWCRGLGRRLGWIEAPHYIIEAFESLQNSTILSPDRLHQMALTDYLNKSLSDNSFTEYINQIRKLYSDTAKVTVEAINNYLGLPYLIPQGGLYTCIKVDENSAEFVEKILKNTGILFVPGWGFGMSLARSIRLSFGPLVNNHEMIIEGIKRVGEYLKK